MRAWAAGDRDRGRCGDVIGVPGAGSDWDFRRCNDGFAWTAPVGSF